MLFNHLAADVGAARGFGLDALQPHKVPEKCQGRNGHVPNTWGTPTSLCKPPSRDTINYNNNLQCLNYLWKFSSMFIANSIECKKANNLSAHPWHFGNAKERVEFSCHNNGTNEGQSSHQCHQEGDGCIPPLP